MVNLIGGYICTLLLLALIVERPSLQRGEERLRAIHHALHAIIILFLVALYLNQSLNILNTGLIVSGVGFILRGFGIWIHEAGHFYLSWAGTTLHFLGGTLFELGVPLTLCAYSLHRRYRFFSALALYWFAFNLPLVAIYAADARERQLPLLGASDSAGHDWGNLLGQYNLLAYDNQIGAAFSILGWVSFVVSIGTYAHAISLQKAREVA